MTLDNLFQRYRDAVTAYNAANHEFDIARNVKTEALNKLNAVQKEANEAFARMKAEAPGGSDWNRDWNSTESR